MHLAVLSSLLAASVVYSQVSIQPVRVAALGRDAVFTCISVRIVSVEWLVNGTSLSSLHLPGVVERFDPIASVGSLRFNDVPLAYNNTRIQCIANRGSLGVIRSEKSILLVQGLLHAVRSLQRTNLDAAAIRLTWTAPFTLDISETGIDITYCVDVINFSTTVHSQCGITGAQFAYPKSFCDDYTFIVTPVNVVGNGTASSIPYSPGLPLPEVMNVVWQLSSSGRLLFFITMTSQVCYGELAVTDAHTGEAILLDDYAIVQNNVTFSSQQLRENHHYDVTVNSHMNHSVHIELSTHGISSTAITEEHNTVTIETEYFESSSASGVLYIFVPLASSEIVDLPGAVYQTLDVNTSLSHMLSFTLTRGRMAVFAYDIESDGTLASGVGYPAVSRELIINQTTQGTLFRPSSSLLERCRATNSEYVIVAQCTYPRNSRVTGFQLIAQLSSPTQVQRLYVDKAVNRQTSASVVVEENGLHQVTIFPIRGERGIVGSKVEFSTQLHIPHDLTTATQEHTTSTTARATPTLTTITAEIKKNTAGMSEPEIDPSADFITPATAIGVGLVITVVSLLVGVTVVILCFKQKYKLKLQPEKETEKDQKFSPKSSQLHDEVRGTPRVSPEYETIEDYVKASDPYHITSCAAYEVATNCR